MEKVGLFHFARSNAGRPRAFAGTPACGDASGCSYFLRSLRVPSLLTGRCFLGASGFSGASGEAPRVASARLADRAPRAGSLPRPPAPPSPRRDRGRAIRALPMRKSGVECRRAHPEAAKGGFRSATKARIAARARGGRERDADSETARAPRSRPPRAPRSRPRSRAKGRARRDARGANARAQPEASLRSAVWRGDRLRPLGRGSEIRGGYAQLFNRPTVVVRIGGKTHVGVPCDRPLGPEGSSSFFKVRNFLSRL